MFKGTTKAVFVDRREYTGPLWEQIDEAFQFVLRNIHLGATIVGIYRQDVYEIPPDAIRELIINAMVHRSYLDHGTIQVAVYDNRLEITSPGKLPMGQTMERMKEGYSKIRNEALAHAFAYMNLIEHWGSGIPRIIDKVKEMGFNAVRIPCAWNQPQYLEADVRLTTDGKAVCVNGWSDKTYEKLGISPGTYDKTGMPYEAFLQCRYYDGHYPVTDLETLLDGDGFGDDFEGVRNQLIIEMLYETGMRRSELIGIRDSDVDFEAQLIKVTGKRNKQRLIPFAENLKNRMLAYMEARNREVGGSEGWFFVRKNGNQLSAEIVYYIVKKQLSAIPMLAKRSPHVLRHSFATSMLNNGAELNAVKDLLGHSSLASTSVYTHTSFEELKKVYHAHPRAQKEGGNYGN